MELINRNCEKPHGLYFLYGMDIAAMYCHRSGSRGKYILTIRNSKMDKIFEEEFISNALEVTIEDVERVIIENAQSFIVGMFI